MVDGELDDICGRAKKSAVDAADTVSEWGINFGHVDTGRLGSVVLAPLLPIGTLGVALYYRLLARCPPWRT